MKTENVAECQRKALRYTGFILHAESGLGWYTHDYPTLHCQRCKLASLIKAARKTGAKVKRVLSSERPWRRMYRLGGLRVTTFAKES